MDDSWTLLINGVIEVLARQQLFLVKVISVDSLLGVADVIGVTFRGEKYRAYILFDDSGFSVVSQAPLN